MITDIRVSVPMVAHGKAVDVVQRRGKDGKTRGSLKKTDDTESWETEFAYRIGRHMPSYLMDFPARIDIFAAFPRPKYLTKVFKKTGLPKYDRGLLPFPQKPDWDNVVKSVQDSLKAHWTDDKLVTWGKVIEAYVELDMDAPVVDGHARQLKPRVVFRIRDVAQHRDQEAAITLSAFQEAALLLEFEPKTLLQLG